MPAFGDQTVNFLHGLSDLWNRFFSDREKLKQIYSANSILMGQSYLDLMENVLNLSIREAPVFGRDFFKLLPIREDLISKRIDGRFAFDLTPYAIKAFKFLQNKILDPTTILEEDLHFIIELDGEEDLLLFHRNPFDWNNDGTGEIVPGVAYRTVEVAQDDGTTTLERELAFWIPDCEKDSFNLYLNFGYLIQRFEPSSESYRALIQGVARYFVLGPTPGILTSALNVICGVPVIRDDGEYLLRVTVSDETQTVVTNTRNYEFGTRVPLRADILDSGNWADSVGADNALTFHSFEHLTELFQIHDALNNWSWWYEKNIPLALLPDESRDRRAIRPILYENLVNNPPGLVKVGDPGVFIGADDDGFVPPLVGAPPDRRPTYRHLFSYIMFERFLRHHTFVIEVDTEILVSGDMLFKRLTTDLQSIVFVGKSAYTYLFTEQEISLTDELLLIEYLAMIAVSFGDVLESTEVVVGENLILGEGAFVGDYYEYTAGGISIGNPWPGWNADGKTPIMASGVNPRNFILTNIEDGVSKHGDWPVQIKVAPYP